MFSPERSKTNGPPDKMAESLANPRQTGTDARPSPPNQRPLQGIFLALRLLGLERELSCLTTSRLNH